jgi:hypothetical protein
MRWSIVIAMVALLGASGLRAQEMSEYMAERELVIVGSTSSHEQAVRIAKLAAERLKAPLKIDDRTPHRVTGLTFSRADCDSNGWSYPCNVARGRGEPDVVTIEHTASYPELTKGLYIVVVGSGAPGEARDVLSAAHRHFPDAYARRVTIYMGCIH